MALLAFYQTGRIGNLFRRRNFKINFQLSQEKIQKLKPQAFSVQVLHNPAPHHPTLLNPALHNFSL
jgi:hypothetical protein